MNTNAIIGIVVAIVVVGGGAWYLSSDSSGTMGEGAENGTDEGGAGASTFAALVAGGGSRTCTVTMDTNGSSSEGTVYISDGKVRGDFTSSVNGQSMTAHMIQADGYMYSWTDAVAQGVKVSLSQAQKSGTTQNQGVDPNAQVDYDCSAWMADSGKFAVPSNVTFMELGANAGANAAGNANVNIPANIPRSMLPADY